MSEGELKKRIKWLAKEPEEFDHPKLSLSEINLLNLIDKAKREFPDVIESIPTFAGCIKYSRKVKEWREKWFGEQHEN